MNMPLKIPDYTLPVIKNVLSIHYPVTSIARKFPEYIYFILILYCIKFVIYWNFYEFPINGTIIKGKYLSFKNREYVKLGIYDQIHSILVKKYTSLVDQEFVNLLHTDTSFVQNEICNIKCRNSYCSRKTGLKISTLR